MSPSTDELSRKTRTLLAAARAFLALQETLEHAQAAGTLPANSPAAQRMREAVLVADAAEEIAEEAARCLDRWSEPAEPRAPRVDPDGKLIIEDDWRLLTHGRVIAIEAGTDGESMVLIRLGSRLSPDETEQPQPETYIASAGAAAELLVQIIDECTRIPEFAAAMLLKARENVAWMEQP